MLCEKKLFMVGHLPPEEEIIVLSMWIEPILTERVVLRAVLPLELRAMSIRRVKTSS